jgi:hypothetical protein
LHPARSKVSDHWCALFCVIKSKSSFLLWLMMTRLKSKEVM